MPAPQLAMQATGSTAVINFAPTLLQKLGALSDAGATGLTMAVAVTKVVGVAIGAWLCEGVTPAPLPSIISTFSSPSGAISGIAGVTEGCCWCRVGGSWGGGDMQDRVVMISSHVSSIRHVCVSPIIPAVCCNPIAATTPVLVAAVLMV